MTIYSPKKVSVWAAAAAILSFVLLIGGRAPAVASAAGAPTSPIVEHVPAAGKRVAVTFDSGWEFADTKAILDVLAQQKVKATFFLRGQWALDHPDLAKAIAAGGHVIGSHSLTHPDMTKLSSTGVEKEIAGAEDALSKTAGARVNLFRPPYGAWNQDMLRLLGERGYQAMIMWDVDSLDWKGLSTDDLVKRVLSLVKPGSIVLMHVGGANTAKALPAILDGLAAKQLEPVTVPDLLAYYKGPPSSVTPSRPEISPAPKEPPAAPAPPATGGGSPVTPQKPGHTRPATGLAAVASVFGDFAERLASGLRDSVAAAARHIASIVRGLGRFFAG